MGYSCKRICKIDFETRSIYGRTYPSFELWPKCTECEIRINYNGNRCPCCNTSLGKRTDEGNKHSRNFTKKLSTRGIKIHQSSKPLKEKYK